MGQLALHVRSPTNRRSLCGPGACAHCDFHTFVSWPRPLWFFLCLGRPVLGYASLIRFGAHGARPHIHLAVTVGSWHSVSVGLHVFLVLGHNSRIVVIMSLTILATIAMDPLSVIIRTRMSINFCTSPRSHIGTSSIPPLTPWVWTLQVLFYVVTSPNTSLKRASFRSSPIWVHSKKSSFPIQATI